MQAPRPAQVDDHFKTNVDGVYAIGDTIPGPMLAHKAEEDGYVLAEMLAGKPGHVDYNHVPSIVYTDPEVRTVIIDSNPILVRTRAQGVLVDCSHPT